MPITRIWSILVRSFLLRTWQVLILDLRHRATIIPLLYTRWNAPLPTTVSCLLTRNPSSSSEHDQGQDGKNDDDGDSSTDSYSIIDCVTYFISVDLVNYAVSHYSSASSKSPIDRKGSTRQSQACRLEGWTILLTSM